MSSPKTKALEVERQKLRTSTVRAVAPPEKGLNRKERRRFKKDFKMDFPK